MAKGHGCGLPTSCTFFCLGEGGGGGLAAMLGTLMCVYGHYWCLIYTGFSNLSRFSKWDFSMSYVCRFVTPDYLYY